VNDKKSNAYNLNITKPIMTTFLQGTATTGSVTASPNKSNMADSNISVPHHMW